ncbi:MAG: hypothetical protein U1E17_06285 [Geminicoccaceae bacterium]
MPADLADLAACERLCAGVDGIVHLGGQAVEAGWEQVLQANIIGSYHLFEAARRQACSASSSPPPTMSSASTTAPAASITRCRCGRICATAPGKAFGEALGRFYADKQWPARAQHQIGTGGEQPLDRRRLAIWISPRDFPQLVRIGLDHPDLHYEVVYGASENDRSPGGQRQRLSPGLPSAGRVPRPLPLKSWRASRDRSTWSPSCSRAARSARPSSTAISG